MTNPMIADLRRELDKARDALESCLVHLAKHAEGNAALHCADRVMYSPLHAKVDAAVAGIDYALERTNPNPEAEASARDEAKLLAVFRDLDRCQHGRHAQDPCDGPDHVEGGGNPHLRPGQRIGYSVRAEPIYVPQWADKHDPAAWRTPPADPTP